MGSQTISNWGLKGCLKLLRLALHQVVARVPSHLRQSPAGPGMGGLLHSMLQKLPLLFFDCTASRSSLDAC